MCYIHVLEWPSHSPNLNQIENLWQNLKSAVQMSPSNITELELFYKEEWSKLSLKYPKRNAADIAAKSRSTKY